MRTDSAPAQVGDRDERRGAQVDRRAEIDHGPACGCRDCALDQMTPKEWRS